MGLKSLNINLENAMNRILILLALILACANVGCNEVVVNGECTSDEQCPGTSVCFDRICVEPEEQKSDCYGYEGVSVDNAVWYCAVEVEELERNNPWSCELNLVDENPADNQCSVLCVNHFDIQTTSLISFKTNWPPSLSFQGPTGRVTCTPVLEIYKFDLLVFPGTSSRGLQIYLNQSAIWEVQANDWTSNTPFRTILQGEGTFSIPEIERSLVIGHDYELRILAITQSGQIDWEEFTVGTW